MSNLSFLGFRANFANPFCLTDMLAALSLEAIRTHAITGRLGFWIDVAFITS